MRDNGKMNRKLLLIGAAVAGGMLAAAPLIAARPAHAQDMPGTSNGILTGPVVGAAPQRAGAQAPPPALPGAHAGASSVVTPLDRPPSEMGPNEALFDAINRGDVAAARDALGRGADLNARNVLGMTPTELSIDLGRNSITFLLLSMGGQGGGAPPPVAVAKAAGKGQAAVPIAHRPPAPIRKLADRQPSAKPRPQQYADVPATPVPQAGFLGFGGAPQH